MKKPQRPRHMRGAEFRELREKMGLTQVQIAEKLGLRAVQISRYENEAIPIPESRALHIRLLAAALQGTSAAR